MPLGHQGALDVSAINDIITTQCQFNSVALTAGSTIPANLITGALDIVLANTTANPGTQTTRTASQIVADLAAQLGLASPPVGLTWFLTIVHGGAGTLTLAAGTGVTLQSASGGPTTVATGTARDYIVQITSPTTVTITALGAKAT